MITIQIVYAAEWTTVSRSKSVPRIKTDGSQSRSPSRGGYGSPSRGRSPVHTPRGSPLNSPGGSPGGSPRGSRARCPNDKFIGKHICEKCNIQQASDKALETNNERLRSGRAPTNVETVFIMPIKPPQWTESINGQGERICRLLRSIDCYIFRKNNVGKFTECKKGNGQAVHLKEMSGHLIWDDIRSCIVNDRVDFKVCIAEPPPPKGKKSQRTRSGTTISDKSKSSGKSKSSSGSNKSIIAKILSCG